MKSLIEHVVTEVSETTFFKELSFTSQQIALPDGATEELADLFVWLESDGIILQIKERAEGASTASHDFDRWFKNKVVRKGSDQVAASLSFFKKHPLLKVKNCRNIEFELREIDSASMCKVIVFGTLANTVEQHHRPNFHLSTRSGFIHLIEAFDFTNLLHWARTPGEMLAYLQFRETYLTQHEGARQRTEKWLFGSFVRWSNSDEDPGLPSISEGEGVVDSLIDDASEIDLREFLEYIGKWAVQRSDNRKDFQKLIVECAHLTRAGFREFKRRIRKCLSRLDQPAPKSLYRIYNEARDCVFAFGVLPPHPLQQAEIGAANYTCLLKYECRASKAVGFFFTPLDEDMTATTPVYIGMPWQRDRDAEEVIKGLHPYIRPLTHNSAQTYSLDDTD